MYRLNCISKIFLVWLCVFFFKKTHSQTIFDNYKNIKNTFSTKSYENQKYSVDSIINIAKSTNSFIDVSKIAHDFSLVSFYAKQKEDAIYYIEVALENQKKDSNLLDNTETLFRAGVFYFQNKDFKNAINCYKKVIKNNVNEVKIAQAYCELALSYYSLNDYFKAIDYYNNGIYRLEKLKEYKKLKREYFNLSTVYNELNTPETFDKHLQLLNKVKMSEKHITLTSRDNMKLNLGFGLVYNRKKDFQESIRYFNKSLDESITNNIDDIKCPSYINLAKIYNVKYNDSAFYFANKALNVCSSNENKSKAYYHISEYYKNNKKYDDALIVIQKSLNSVLNNLETKYNSNLGLNSLLKSKDKDHLLFLIKNKVQLLKRTKKTNLALQHVLVADSLIDIIQSETTYTTKLHWRTKASEVYTHGIEICHTLDKPKTAFYLSEKGKALLLTEAIIKNKALSQLPDSITNKISELKKVLTAYKANGNENLLFESQLSYDKYIDSLKTKFPSYFKNKSLQNIISLDSVKKALDNNAIVVSYFWPNTDEETKTVFALFVTKEKSSLLKIGNAEAVNNLLANYREVLSKPFSTTEDKNTFNKTAYQLYHTLLKPQETAIDTYKNILIIPDENLHNIPFGALTKDKHSLDYLIKHQNISYAYSLSFLDYNNQRQRTTKQNFIGFAPRNFEALKLNSLKNSVSELEKATSIINGDMVIDTAATKAAFFKTTEDAKIIHLATHAEASENPWIAFSDKKLSLEELYNYKNNAELTVLSGCETSIGEIATGEGVMSLARGFFYSGSNAVVASLWNVDDKSTSIIMEDFYKNLEMGKTKSEALRLAKLNYIETHSLSEASPYYWSSFVLLGNTASIELNTSISVVYYIALFLFVILILLFFRKRTKSLGNKT